MKLELNLFPSPKNKRYLLKYISIIEKILQSRENIKRDGFERHHIIPKSFGGSNRTENLIYLTCKEHFVIHHILHLAFGKGMTRAFYFMCHYKYDDCRISAREYERLRLEWYALPAPMKGRKQSEETKRKISEAFSNGNHPWTGKTHTEESKEKISKSRLGKKMSEKFCINNRLNKIGELNGMYGKESAMKGKKHTDETKKKCSEAKLGELNPMFGKTISEETRKKYKERQTGKIWVTNGIIETHILPEELEQYVTNGWIRGRKPRLSQ